MANNSDAQTEGVNERLLPENGGVDGEAAGSGKSRKGCCGWISSPMQKTCNEFHGLVADLYEMGRSDPRKVIFAVKVGLALALVALFIFWQPVENASKYAIWAILTVVVVFEFSVGATLSKGFNRGIGTLCAGGLALGIAEVAVRSGGFEEVILAASIFWAGFFASYIKLSPIMKSYEYGFRIFLLTFSLVLITGNTSSNFYTTAFYRLVLIAIGAAIAFTVNIFVFPIWAGEDLHKLVVKNFRGVATSLEGCVDRYRRCLRRQNIPSTILTFQADDDPLYVGYRDAVQSYNKEESLLEYAKWEPPHGPYRMLKYPWKSYVRVAGALRHCTFMVMAMHGCILSEIQAPLDKRQVFASELQRVGSAGARVLRELGNKLEKMERLSSGYILQDVHEAAEELQMKIDQNSHLLINIHHCEDENHASFKDMENHAVLNSLSEFSVSAIPEESTEEDPALTGHGSWHSMTIDPSVSGMNSTADFPSMATFTGPKWPSLYAINMVTEKETLTAESASSLSLATFASLLIEFVARLQNVVDSYNDLCDLANFKEAGIEPVVKISWWKKLLACFQSKN
ncbi:hypothetical protein V2J09_008742 [Rumex salicifolius]